MGYGVLHVDVDHFPRLSYPQQPISKRAPPDEYPLGAYLVLDSSIGGYSRARSHIPVVAKQRSAGTTP